MARQRRKTRSRLWFILLVLMLLVPLFIVTTMGLTLDQVTPNDKFFTEYYSFVPDINASSWSLGIGGLVDHPVHISYHNLTNMPSKEVKATLKCVQGAAGLAVWKGVPLRDLLAIASVKPGAIKVVTYGADGYSSDLTVDEANSSNVLVAYMMNGVPLPKDQGYPVRLVVPEMAGYKWVMWITNIALVSTDYKGYWETHGWSDNATLRPYTDWALHAYLESVGFVFMGLALASGERSGTKINIFHGFPKFLNKRFHRYSSIIALGILVMVFIYWVIVTIQQRGAIFYTSHGAISGLMVALFAAAGVTGMKVARQKGERTIWNGVHRGLSIFGFLLYSGVIFLGLILAYGSVL